jgi:hypothetical protein
MLPDGNGGTPDRSKAEFRALSPKLTAIRTTFPEPAAEGAPDKQQAKESE